MALTRVSKTVILVAVGVIMAVMGLLSYIMFPRILKWQVEENLILSPEAEPYEFWRVIPVPIYCKFYFFNITNTKDIIQNKAKPFLQELGPYTFRETREKVNITWHPNGTVSYFQIKRWYFEPDMTTGSLDDLITTVNVPLATAVNKGIRSGDPFFLSGVDAMAEHAKSTLYVTRSVSDLLFDGYKEELFDVAKDMGIEVPYEKFGWFYPKNGSDDGEYTIFTGKNDVMQYGYVNLYKGSSLVPGRHPPCNAIGGTAGDMWPPFRDDKKEKLDLFVSDICSTLQLTYLSEVEVNEIESYRYWLDETAFDNGKHNELNSCQCTDTCMPPGALDIEICQFGTPAVVSFPHFLYADQQYSDKIDGLKPDPDRHMFFIDLEPKLGIPVNVDARLQINVAIPNCDELEKVTDKPRRDNVTKVHRNIEMPEEKIFYPIFWFSESASINLETAEKLKFVTKMLPQYVTIGCFLSVACGGVIIIVVLHQTVRHIRRKPKKQMVYTAVRVVPQNFK